MWDWLTIIFLFYSFVAFYFLFMYILIYIPNRKKFYLYPKLTKNYSLSIVIPCYNEEKDIGGTIQALLDLNYKGLKKIIIVDDCSTDSSYNIIKKYAKKYSKIMVVQTPKNTGKASGAKNYGAKFVKTELIGFTDADSSPKKDSIRKMIGFFDDKNTSVVTSMIMVKNRLKLIENLQAIEYKIIAFTRKLLGFVGAIYVTPGPLALYRKSAFDEVKGFDEENLTEDIEITWNLVGRGYGIQMCVPSRVYTVVPNTIKGWFKQRIRWNVGGIQTIFKYKKDFFKRGMLGSFILPFFMASWLLGIFGLFVLIYRVTKRFIVGYLSTVYSVQAQTAILTFRDINLTPNVLVFFGLTILIFSILFTAIALKHSKEKDFKKHGVVNIIVYLFFYLLTYPMILVISLYKYGRGKKSW